MSDNEDEEEKPTRAQLEAAYPGRTFMDGGVSENQLAAAYPEVADAEGDGVSIPEDELEDLSADRPRTGTLTIEATDDSALHGLRLGECGRASVVARRSTP